MHETTTENIIERFPAMAYGTLVGALAGWKAVQRYRSVLGSTTSSNVGWLLDIFIRQVISAGYMIHRYAERPFRDSLIYYVLLALLEMGVSILW
jgi:hypothetical protein